jgi:uncharacterized membrane protein YkvA (DUF1232 family)
VWLWILVASALGIVVAALAGWWLVRRYARPPKQLVERVGALSWRQRFDFAVGLMRDERLPIAVRLLIPALALYLLLPLDIIPDFIPVVGALDDILVILVVLRLVLRSIPAELLDEHLDRYEVRHALPGGEDRVRPARQMGRR